MSDDFTDQPDPYWQQDAVNDRDEYEQHLDAVLQDELDRLAEHGA